MPQTANTDTCFTRVRNATGSTRVFGFLGDRGVRLGANETFLNRGDPRDTLAGHKRKFDGLCRALVAGDLVIETTPPPVLWDPVLEQPQMVALSNNVLGIVDPSWDEEGSSDFQPADDDNHSP